MIRDAAAVKSSPRHRRPSEGTNERAARSGSNSSTGATLPRVKAKAEETRTATSTLHTTLPTNTPASYTPVPTPPSHTKRDEGDVSKTFLTALMSAKCTAKKRSETLRPPSPFEAIDTPTDGYAATTTNDVWCEPSPANYMGVEALQMFWGMFHRQDGVHQNTQITLPSSISSPASPSTAAERPTSARTTYLSAVRKTRLSPEPMGIVRRRVLEKGASSAVSSSSACSSGSTAQEINLNSYRMGDAYALAFSQGFPLIPAVESINLAHNRISDTVAAQIIKSASKQAIINKSNTPSTAAFALQQLNLAHNALAHTSSMALCDLLRQSKSLTALNLSHNALKDRDIHILCEALQKNQTLLRLHLSENKFGINGMVSIAKFLEENSKIEEVYLSWNNIRGVGALKIVEALKFHASLRACDLSWNSLDSNELLKPRTIITALADSLTNNKVLSHLDLSNNHLDMEDCAILAKQLESNHTLIGLHMAGNCGVMDSRGYLIPKKTTTKLLDQHKMYSMAVFEETHSESGSGAFPQHLAQLVDKYCWYCGQWSEYRFAWQPTSLDGPFASTDNVFEVTSHMAVRLHLSLDDWRGINMERREDGSFSAYRILPPGKTEYFFSVFNKNDLSQASYHYIKEKRHQRRTNYLGDAHEAVFGDLQYVNVVRIARREGRDPCNTLVPRFAGKTNDRSTRWDINKSVFARRRRESVCRNFVDTDTFVGKACAADWKQCKVDRFIKDANRRKEVENCVLRNYRVICSLYRRYCGHNVLSSIAATSSCSPAVIAQLQNDIISVPWSGYVEFLNECKILDESSEYCKFADLENVFVAANLELTQEAKEKDNPDRSLTRFEFLECAMRIAINKYHRTNICDTPAKAMEKLIQDNILPIAPEDTNDFRTRFLYTEEVSEVFSEHIVLIQDVFNSNMGKYCKPGEKKGMQLMEFLTLMETYQVYNDTFRVRDIKDPFLACKLVVLDEMATVGHKKLYMTDFMELLLRICVLRYPPKPFTVVETAKSLQKLLINHFATHENLLEQFRSTVDQAVVQDRVEAFANAINANMRQQKPENARRSRSRPESRQQPAQIMESADEGKDDEEEQDEDVDDQMEEPSNDKGQPVKEVEHYSSDESASIDGLIVQSSTESMPVG